MKRLIGLLALLSLCACIPTAVLPATNVLPNARVAATVPFEDFETYYEVVGPADGQPILMVHGIGGGSSLFQYRKNAAELARQGYEVYALDLLGFGRSTRPAIRTTQDLHVGQLESFIETNIGEPTALVGNGLSAAYSIRLAAERPDLVEGLILIAPTGYERLARSQGEARVRAFDRFRGFLGNLIYTLLVAENIQDIFLLDAYISEASITPEVRAEFDRQLRAANAKWVILSFISGNLDQDVSGLWPETTQPALILWGAQAETTPVKDAEAFLAARPEVELVTIEGAKLLPNEDRPEAFNRAVLDFLGAL